MRNRKNGWLARCWRWSMAFPRISTAEAIHPFSATTAIRAIPNRPKECKVIERWHHWPGRNRYQIFGAVAVALLAVTSSSGGTLPRLEGKSLAGKNVVLPDDARGSAAILIFGFTRASRSNTEAWSRRLADDKTLSGVKIYNLPVLESVPRI